MHTGRKALAVLLTAAALLTLPACKAQPISETSFVLNTVASVALYDGSDPELIDGAFRLCTAYENRLSRTISDSEISLVNAGETRTVSDDTAALIRTGLDYGALSGGAFDITLGAVTALWDFTAASPSTPDGASLARAAATVGYQSVSLSGREISFSNTGTQLDLGAIAKGFVADRVKDYLVENGVESAVINLGGNILCIGQKPDGSGFTVGIQRPFGEGHIAVVQLSGAYASVVTSGIYERGFELDGKYYHHLLDPKTGMPCSNGLLSVTIISADSVTGDALSTACFVLGLEAGMELIDGLDDVFAIFVDENYTLHFSAGLLDTLSVSTTS